MWRVLCDAKWGAVATSDEKKQSELVIEYFNSMLADNCSRAVHSQYPAAFEQVEQYDSKIDYFQLKPGNGSKNSFTARIV